MIAKSKPIQVGVIGSGTIARSHVNAYQESGRAQVLGVVDVDEARAEALAEAFGVPHAFRDYHELLKLDEVEAVSICTPNDLHAPMTIDTLRSGKHVLCEKPMAINVEAATQMEQAAETYRRVLMIAFFNRFRDDSHALKWMIQAGALGEIYHVAISMIRRRGIPSLGSWFTRKERSGGGTLIDSGCHVLDLALWLMGFPQPETVSACTYAKFGNRDDYLYLHMWGGAPQDTPKFDVEDYATAFVRFAGGASMAIECSWAANAKDSFYIDLLGTRGGARLDHDQDLEIYTEHHGHLADLKPLYKKTDPFLEEIDHFLDRITGVEAEPLCTPEEGVVVQQIIEAVYTSADRGREVEVKT
ncbi:MAG: Gfo/Idh/MocA family protein [Candidatus Bipolaricaulia bacterium]